MDTSSALPARGKSPFCSHFGGKLLKCKTVDALNLHPIAQDWHGAAPPGGPQWALAIKDSALQLRGRVCSPPACIPGDRKGSFVESLWEGDVVELYLLNPNTGFYIEFNLAPRGAWWCCAFDSPRVRSASVLEPPADVKTLASASEAGWDSALSVPLASLPKELSFDPNATMGNIAFCLGEPRQYVTLADLGGGAPDFHRPDKWIALKKILDYALTPNLWPLQESP